MNELKEHTKRLLSHPIFQQASIATAKYFPEHIDETLKEYSKVLNDKLFWEAFYKTHYPNQPVEYTYFSEIIDEFSVYINKSLDAYYLGKLNEAYTHLKDGLNKILFGTSKLFKEAVLIFPKNTLTLYRIRVRRDSDPSDFGRKEIFHIPFQKRGLVSTQRYSIPGHPCLYFGNSIFVCWTEINQPPLKDIYASKFVNNETLKLIEIKSVYELLEEIKLLEGAELSSAIFRFILFYPLTVAASIKVTRRTDTFKPEYIIPQLFLQYILNEKTELDGIKYFSTRIEAGKTENVGTSNFVFPSRTNKKEGYCPKLIHNFKLTFPILWEYEEINIGNVTFWDNEPDHKRQIELYKGRKVPYNWTTFSAIENALSYESLGLELLAEK